MPKGPTTEHGIMIECFLCRSKFPFGPHTYNGSKIRAWGIMVCDTCRRSNWDGVVPSNYPHLVDYLQSQGLDIPLNDNGWISIPN